MRVSVHGIKMFDTEQEAATHFDCDIEQCDRCGCWSASMADHDEGAIECGGTTEWDRLCIECDYQIGEEGDG